MSVATRCVSSCALLGLICAGCSLLWDPFLEERPQDSPQASHDQSAPPGSQDLGSAPAPSCTDVPDNRVQNPSFEVPAIGTDPDGKANNTGDPRSTIPGPFNGCCVQSLGGTQWAVTAERVRCGQRSLQVLSQDADGNVLSQRLADQPDAAGKPFLLAGFVLVQQTDGGGRILIEVLDAATQTRVASTETLSGPTMDWVSLRQRGVIPKGGQMQLRISSSGSIHAYVDDLSLRIP